MIQAQFEKTYDGWRTCAREFLKKNVLPNQINWSENNLLLLDEKEFELKTQLNSVTEKVPAEFLKFANAVAWARQDDRWDLLYRILFRLTHENKNLLNIHVEPDVHRLQMLAKSVRRDIHKMHAFVRFKMTEIEGVETFVAWHKPEHIIIKPGSEFFVRRFGDKPWSIFTPDGSAHWNLKEVFFGPGMEQRDFEFSDEWDEAWKDYYKSIFNPARIKIKAMKQEMAPKYWSALPEADLIRDLVKQAPKRLQSMRESQSKAAVVNPDWNLNELSQHASSCQACPLFKNATQTVFGVGPSNAKIMIVGEQPGDQEDLSGQPFVGPAGEVLNQALLAAGINREKVYLTNAVKHFKWEQRGKVRLHKKPSGSEMHACKPWLEAEVAKVKPQVIIALGATAGTAVMGKLPKITQDRGQIFSHFGMAPNVVLSWHPSAILRSMSEEERIERTQQLIEDLKLAVGSQAPK